MKRMEMVREKLIGINKVALSRTYLTQDSEDFWRSSYSFGGSKDWNEVNMITLTKGTTASCCPCRALIRSKGSVRRTRSPPRCVPTFVKEPQGTIE
jgi:hypothetical protein